MIINAVLDVIYNILGRFCFCFLGIFYAPTQKDDLSPYFSYMNAQYYQLLLNVITCVDLVMLGALLQAVNKVSTFRLQRVDVVKEVANFAYLRAILSRLHK